MEKDQQKIAIPSINSMPIRDNQFSFVRPFDNMQFTRNAQNQNDDKKNETTQTRPYEWTFRKPTQVPIDYGLIRRLGTKVEQTQQLIKQKIQINQFDSKTPYNLPTVAQKVQTQLIFNGNGFNAGKKTNKEIKEVRTTIRMSTIIKKQEQFAQLNCELPNVYESEVILRKDSEDYKADMLNICGNEFITSTSKKFKIKDIKKIKISAEVAKGRSFRIKLIIQKEVYTLGVELKRELYYLPQHYIWFAKLINAKLIQMGYKLQIKDGMKLMDANYILGGIFDKGVIYKCSKYRKKWQRRFIVINTQGLFSYKNQQQNYTVSIPVAQIEQLWSNFDIIDKNLIIKLKHKGDNTEFAIPIQDYCLRQDSNWLFAFYRLLMQHKIHIKSS